MQKSACMQFFSLYNALHSHLTIAIVFNILNCLDLPICLEDLPILKNSAWGCGKNQASSAADSHVIVLSSYTPTKIKGQKHGSKKPN